LPGKSFKIIIIRLKNNNNDHGVGVNIVMVSMHVKLNEVIMEHKVLRGQLTKMQKKVEILEQKFALR
jgi:hypothetical protein